MTKQWLVACGAVAVLAGSVASAQEHASMSPEMVVKLKAEAETEQALGVAKMRVPLESKTVAGAPYSAETVTESIETLADGNRIVHRTTGRVYRDGEGRVRREDDRGPGQAPVVSITDPVAKLSYSLDPDNKVAMKTQSTGDKVFFYLNSNADPGAATYVVKSDVDPADVVRRRHVEQQIVTTTHADQSGVFDVKVDPSIKTVRHAPAWDEKVEKLPAKQVEGVLAEGTRTTRTIPAGAIGNERPIVMVTEEWRSPELQVLVATTTSDPRTGESTYKLTNIARGEPGQSWFEVPAGYTVRDSGMVLRNDFVIKHDQEK